jgi:hypothetical protein
MSLSARATTAGLVSRMMVMEFIASIAIIGVACTVLLQYYEVAMFKAKFTDVLLALSAQRVGATERFAHTGAWTDADVVATAATVRGRTVRASLRPAAADSELQWSIVWSCSAPELPPGFAPSVCRPERAR